jgi:hypothetical protein
METAEDGYQSTLDCTHNAAHNRGTAPSVACAGDDLPARNRKYPLRDPRTKAAQ